jgi:thymidine phosphorylase
VTATVPSIPLITASIMSKKLAESLDALVLDVKFGSGAFMKSLELARSLARSLVETGKRMGVHTTALLTDMNQPLGRLAGNLVEVHEAIACLKGEGPADLWELTCELAAELVGRESGAGDRESVVALLEDHIASGRAQAKFTEMVAAQGGDLDRLSPMPTGLEIAANRGGFVASIDTEVLGLAIIELGGGRKAMGDAIDHSVGLEMLARVGDRVDTGQPLVRVFGTREQIEHVRPAIERAIGFQDEPLAIGPLIVERVNGSKS